ncbi:phage tail tube protein [Methylophilus sp. VKM B-3414]|uniref:phage tail tube protein n=1 Tax=Methylophilus sp. VKM B-3414 TaxID=3076121 RepID=UPI0028D0C78D|nr:phage tail tube protein [Methylophilus sp. VKM B-3414]
MQIAMQSAVAAAKDLTAITKANPGVAACASHGYANGEYLRFKNVLGMYQVNNRIIRVAGQTTGNFNLEGEDTTLYGTFVSGQVEKVTFGTTFSTFLDCSVTGGDFPQIDTTTIHDLQKSSQPGMPNGLVITSNNIWDVSDAALIAAKKQSDAQTLSAFLVTFQNGQKFVINGYIGCTLSPAGNAQEKVTTQIVITGVGSPTVYAS